MKGWVKIYATSEDYLAELMITKLKDHGIASVKMNKKDSAYGTFGEVEVYVQQVDAVRALHLIGQQEEQ